MSIPSLASVRQIRAMGALQGLIVMQILCVLQALPRLTRTEYHVTRWKSFTLTRLIRLLSHMHGKDKSSPVASPDAAARTIYSSPASARTLSLRVRASLLCQGPEGAAPKPSSMVEVERSASTYVAVAGLLIFGTITSLLAKIGAFCTSEGTPRLHHLLPSNAISAASFAVDSRAMHKSYFAAQSSPFAPRQLRLVSYYAVYELDGPDRSGVNKLFRKPWMMTTIMFIGMSFCIPIAYAEAFWQRRKQRKENDGAHAPLLNGTTEEARPSLSQACGLTTQTSCQSFSQHTLHVSGDSEHTPSMRFVLSLCHAVCRRSLQGAGSSSCCWPSRQSLTSSRQC